MRFVPDTPATPRFWQVCFMGEERRFWWDWLLPHGFRHVFLLGWVSENRIWICYDVMAFKTEITILSESLAGGLLTLAHQQGAVLTWRAPGAVQGGWIWRLGFWCVPAVKHVLGIGCVAMTPKGLHRYLVRHGAEPLVGETT